MLNLKQSYRMGVGRLTVYCGEKTRTITCSRKEAITYYRFIDNTNKITWNGQDVDEKTHQSWNK